MIQTLYTPMTRDLVKTLRCGDRLLLTGEIYTARDAAHKRMVELIAQGRPLPLPIQDAIIYYAGPSPAKEGEVIGSIGPTTSIRMDSYAPDLIRLGLTGMIGKGQRRQPVIDAMKEFGAVYLGAVGGTAALLADCVEKVELVAYEDLGPEAIRRLTVRDFPVTVVIDSQGNNLYENGPKDYLKQRMR